MSWASSEAVGILTFLLPGFVAAGIFQSLISNPRPSGFDVVVRALFFTMVVQLVAHLVFWGSDVSGWNIPPDEAWEIVVLVLVSAVLGLISAYVWNNDLLHRPLRRLNVTRQSSYQSAQYSAFAFHRDCYVVLHLKGERRLYGWPREWPSRPDDQHFLVEDCEWLVENGRKPIPGVSHILIPKSEVEMIEFLPADPNEEPAE